MTTINNKAKEQCSDPALMRADMAFDPAPKGGVEIEYHIQDLRADGAPAKDERVSLLKENLRLRHNIAVDDEIAAHMIEVKTGAYELSALPLLMAEIERIQAAVMREALALDLKPVPFGNMAGLTAEKAFANLITPTREEPQRGARARMIMAAMHADNKQHLMAYPLLNVSAQISIGAKDPDHLFAMVRRHNILLPFLMTLFHNRPPRFDGRGRIIPEHSGIAQRAGLGRRGLVPPHFAHSHDGESYLHNHLRAVFNRAMYGYVDAAGDFRQAAQGEKITLASLRRQGLATKANAALSLSMDWHAAKMKTIPDTAFMRAELRDIDTSGHAAASMAAIAFMMNLDEECGQAMDGLLAGYGYPAAPLAIANNMHLDLQAARRQATSYLDLPFGAGTMRHFGRDFAAILRSYAQKYRIADQLEPLFYACESGMSEAKALAQILPDAAAVARYQRDYDPELLANPRTSLALALQA